MESDRIDAVGSCEALAQLSRQIRRARVEITIDRLECITRAENLRRNGVWRDPELGKLYQLKGAIARQVNRIRKESA